MVTNNDYIVDHVKFVSYTGKFPNLCGGILTLEIDGKEVRFGHDYTEFESWKTDGNFDRFWTSNGGCYFSTDNLGYTTEGEWIIDASCLPKEYRGYVYEIDIVFNENVPHGCCGGCL